MSVGPDESADLIGGTDYGKLSLLGGFNSITVKTGTVSGNSTVQFTLDESEDIVDSVSKVPEDANLPKRGRLIFTRVNVASGSTDSDINYYQSDSFDEINRVVAISGASESDTPSGFSLAGALGASFINKNQDNDIYVEISENSAVNSVYELEIHWYNL